MSAFLEIKHLRKTFGGVVAVDENSFTVEKGIRLGIIGPNGAGKTTTFNMIAGFYKPTAGTIEFEGRPISGLKPHRISQMGIGRTFQNVRAFREITVYDHVMAGALATRPKLLLLDELMAGLTFVEIEEMLMLLNKINEEMGITLIVVEHVMKVIMELCRHIVVLNYGRIIAEGTPHEISNNQAVIEAYLGQEEKYA